MKKLHFTREQVTKIFEEIAQQEDGFNMVLKLILEAIARKIPTIHYEINILKCPE